MNPAAVRRVALALPEASEAPHFERTSFRVRDKIFATIARDGRSMNVFVDDEQREIMVRVDPETYQTLTWGKIAYLRVQLEKAKAPDVEALLRAAWERKAPKKLVAETARD